jgi:hypothetical protein
MKAYSYLFAIICLNLAAFSLVMTNTFRVANIYQFSIDDVQSMFALSEFDISVAIGGGAIIGIIVALLKTYTFAAGALVLWVITIIIKPIRLLLTGFPTMITNILLTTVPELTWFTWIITTFLTMAFFILFIELLSGKQIT